VERQRKKTVGALDTGAVSNQAEAGPGGHVNGQCMSSVSRLLNNARGARGDSGESIAAGRSRKRGRHGGDEPEFFEGEQHSEV
jgi:hypothetical protein